MRPHVSSTDRSDQSEVPDNRPGLLSRFSIQRDRAQALIPALRSIDSAIHGAGKESLKGTGGDTKPGPPESADQILSELEGILAEAHQLVEHIHVRL